MRRHDLLLALIALACVGASRAFAQSSSLDYTDYCTTGALVECASVDISVAPVGTPVLGEQQYALTVAFQNLQGTDPRDNSGGYGIVGFGMSLNLANQLGDQGTAFFSAGVVGTTGTVGTAGSVGVPWGDVDGDDQNPPCGALNPNIPATSCGAGGVSGNNDYLQPANAIVGCNPVPLAPSPGPVWNGLYSTCPANSGDDWVSVTLNIELTNELANAPPLTVADLSAAPGWITAQGYQTGEYAFVQPGVNAFANTAVTVTPEPETIALFATGLTGIGGLGVLRRKRSRPISEA